MRFTTRQLGAVAAVVTVGIWTGFILIGRASAARTLLPLDIALLRILGASAVLLPWGLWLTRGRRGSPETSLGGLSPLPLRTTVVCGLFGGPIYAVLCYAGFFYAPAAHASVLMPGSLPLWTALLAAALLHDRITAARALGLACIVAGALHARQTGCRLSPAPARPAGSSPAAHPATAPHPARTGPAPAP